MRNEIKRTFIITLILTLCFPLIANANVIWPSLYIAEGMRSWHIIILGLIIEFCFIKIFAKETWIKAFIIAFVMNAISAVIGIILIPAGGILGEIILIPLGKGTFHWSHWILDYILAVLGNVLIEGLVLKFIFKYKFKKVYWWLLTANALSVIICIISYGFNLENLSI